MQPATQVKSPARRFTPPSEAPQLPTHQPPQRLELEVAVLGAAMLEAPATAQLLSLVQDEHVFYDARHRLVFQAMQALAEQQLAIDQLTVVGRLRDAGTLARAGGVGYVAGLTMHINSAAHLESHVRKLQDAFLMRKAIEAGTRIVQRGYDALADPHDVLSEASATILAAQQAVEQRPTLTVADEFGPLFEQLRQDVQREGLTGVPTGLTEFNNYTGGFQPGDLIILAARPAMGKTAVMLHFARTASLDHDKHTFIASLEMPRRQLVQRLVASEAADVTNADLRHGKLVGQGDQVELARQLEQQAERLLRLGHRLHVDDTAGLSLAQLRAKCHRLHAETPLGLVLVDYLQLMRGEQRGRVGNREQEISSISRGLKELAKELHVPVIALSQLSRSVEQRGGQKRPQLADLRESGAIEQDADMIVFLWRGEYYKIDEYDDGSQTKNTILFDIAKHRNGNVGEFIAGCKLANGLVYDLGTEPGTPPAELAAADDFQPRTIRLSTQDDFNQPLGLPNAPADAPF